MLLYHHAINLWGHIPSVEVQSSDKISLGHTILNGCQKPKTI